MAALIDRVRSGTKEEFNFPKAELHCHLDGTFRLTTLIEIAKKRNIELPSYDPETLRSMICVLTRKKDLAEYLASFSVISPVFAGCKEAIARLTREAIEDKYHHGVRYIEFRLSPQLLANSQVNPMVYAKEKGDVTPRVVLQTVCTAVQEAKKDFPITVRLLLCCILGLPDWSMEVAHMCKEFAEQGVVGIDIAGSPTHGGPQISDHAKAFNFCRDNGIHITAHAGEAGDAQEVDKAMNVLHAQRIGHGYHTVDDERVYAESKRRNIHFEVCPLSSYYTASVDADLSRHPAIRFWKDQVNFSLNTDDPGVQQTTIFDDYKLAFSDFKFSVDAIKQLNLNALQSSFCEDSVKEKLLEEFRKAYKC